MREAILATLGIFAVASGCSYIPNPLADSNDDVAPEDTVESDGLDSETSFCGDGIVDDGEACDDGNTDETDLCTNLCLLNVCGDGHVQAGVEDCDDGNTDPFDSCTNECGLPTCGDGIVQGSEECDAGDSNGAGMACRGDCTLNVCGDGDPGPGEGCDDGNQIDNDGCNNMCALASCGDSIVQAPEECDGPNFNGANCMVLGYDGGSLTCNANCAMDTSDCTNTPQPGLGQLYSNCLDPANCPGLDGCATFTNEGEVDPFDGYCTNFCTTDADCFANTGGTAVPQCNDAADPYCELDCSGGKTCPGGMECLSLVGDKKNCY